ncbi:MAG TPA: chorismate synthase [Candidatus Omnitrophota bacterium]|nr:chorismate synthase [Candidatus Omnitrophota bacterium]
MSGNSVGKIFQVTTFGESHGVAMGAVIDGVLANIPLTAQDVQKELDRRRPGQSAVTTQRREKDRVMILSGIMNGKTTGTPIGLLIYNEDANPKDYLALKDIFRPGHADFVYQQKYGIRDWRGGGRSSGRETAMRVAAGAIAKKILARENMSIVGYVKEIAGIKADKIDLKVIEKNAVRAPDLVAARKMITKIERVRQQGDSVGGIIEVVVNGCPVGLGEPVFDKLNAQLAASVMSIGAVKGVEFGAGFAAKDMLGSEFNDVVCFKNKKLIARTNHNGGISAGISNGQQLVMRAVIRPTCSIAKQQTALTRDLKTQKITIAGRHDPCICPRAVVVVEAMVAITLADALLVARSRS